MQRDEAIGFCSRPKPKDLFMDKLLIVLLARWQIHAAPTVLNAV
jgi:hypothetical protein